MQQQTIRNTQLVRNIMRKHGKEWIFTNKYKNSRTVKCYARSYTETYKTSDSSMIRDIEEQLTKANIDFEIRTTEGFRPGIIVQVPMDY